MKSLKIVLVATAITMMSGFSLPLQTRELPRKQKEAAITKESKAVILNLYDSLNTVPAHISRADYAVKVIEKHFDKSFIGHGGRSEQSYTLDDFKRIIHEQFTENQELRNSVEDIVAEGSKVVVRIKLSDGNTTINYISSYHVKNGKVVERWAYGDANFN